MSEDRGRARRDDIRQHILAVSSKLFYQKGIRAVGIEEILREANVAKATLYRHFASKEALVLAYLHHRSAFAVARLHASGEHLSDPVAKILAAFAALDVNLNSPDFRGCAFLLAVSEHGESQAIRDIAIRHKLAFQTYFGDLLRSGGIASEALTSQIVLIYDGALAIAAIRPDAAPGTTALDLVRGLLAAASAQA